MVGGRHRLRAAARVVVTPARPAHRQRSWRSCGSIPGSRPRDLFWGVGGRRYAPPPRPPTRSWRRTTTGFSVSYDVTSPDGTEWSAKIGPEAQTEVVVSRILWGLGYHQPPIYYLPSWTLANELAAKPQKESEARFRPKLPQLERLPDVWSWADNPFSGTRELKGLLVILLMLNSTDLKDDNNSIYQLDARRGTAPARWFVVRDLGAALGETGKLYPRRNWLEGFEKQAFITAVDGDRGRVRLRRPPPGAAHDDHAGRRAVGGAADVAAHRRAVARRVPRRQLRHRRCRPLHRTHQRENRRRPRASRRPPRVTDDERR